MTTIGARTVNAAIALKPLGLSLIASSDGFTVTAKPDDPEYPRTEFATIDQLEAFIAEHRRTASVSVAKPVEQRKPQVCDPVHYVSHGSPVREDGSQAYKSTCRAAIVTEVFDTDPAPEDGAPYVSLFVVNPTGTFHDQGVRYDPGTFTGPARTASPGEPLPLVTCDDLTFEGGTWHWPGGA